MKTYLEATAESGQLFYRNLLSKGEFIMLNLLRYNTTADYKAYPHLQPAQPITGEAAYQLYMNAVMSELKNIESQVLFYGETNYFLIGPQEEKWDAMLLVKHKSVARFMEFAQTSVYLKNRGHKVAALKDFRLLPSKEKEGLLSFKDR
ncbi:DUF1330 domain-containing protein [Aquimarina sp. ERC-38]|uniref:DUF1330 domain-containing protein n=1 Tax=Aquimarina sp. ERC-38 TaxID=2949996 RepID=UPI00224518AF|nr:DUF1330 domain-containing protein [Aquimarina sp. ERC-38]UZO82544.1 DUF1330 domain-containing protein [Aquimarina sp. ERC-38]